MIQVYYGDGKGKTTAAIGASVRAVGSGMNVLFAQLLKNGDSSEISVLESIGVRYFCSSEKYTLFETPTDNKNTSLKTAYNILLTDVANSIAEYDLIVFDEILDAVSLQLVNEAELISLLTQYNTKEFILTGHAPSDVLYKIADYISEVQMLRHPYQNGTPGRKGIEY